MNHLIAAPFLLPGLTACILVLLGNSLRWQRVVSIGSSALCAVVCGVLLVHAESGPALVYAFGNWPAHLGVVFVLDRLSATMIAMSAIVALAALLHSVPRWDEGGRHFHAIFHCQCMGLNGAFLTGDLFNLFVCFEIMLISSYALLSHGGGVPRLRANVSYVTLNLTGSALFLIAVSLLYRAGGTLNMADLGVAFADPASADVPWIRAGALLLLVVFLLKAAIVPLHSWLPSVYTAAAAPAAALFAVLTKVGAYATLRVGTVVFGLSPAAAGLEASVLPLALVTLVLASLGAFTATTLSQLAAWLAAASSASVLMGIGAFSLRGVSGGILYAVASTLAIAALFLLSDIVASVRGGAWQDRLSRGPRVSGSVAAWFFIVSIAVAGMPPLAVFLAKATMLSAFASQPSILAVALAASALQLFVLARAGIRLFWSTELVSGTPEHVPSQMPSVRPLGLLMAAIAALTIAAGHADRYVREAVSTLIPPSQYLGAVLEGSGLKWRLRIDVRPQAGEPEEAR